MLFRSFFYIALSHNTLENHYSTVFSLVQHHKYSISDVENLIPFELDIYVNMLKTYLAELERQQTGT